MAAGLCRDTLIEQPRDDKVRVLLGTVLVRQNKFAAAEKELRDVISRFPEIPKAQRELGNALIAQGKGDEAIECYKRVIELTPDDPAAHRDLSHGLQDRWGRKQGCGARARRLIRDRPGAARSLSLAMEHHRDWRVRQGREHLPRGITPRKEPKNVNATRIDGHDRHGTLGKPRLAARMFRNAVKLAPDFFGAHAWTSPVRLIEIGRTGRVRRGHSQEAIRLQPDLPTPLFAARHYLYSKRGRFEEAVESLQGGAWRSSPIMAPAWPQWATRLKTIGHQEESIDTYRDCITRSSRNFGEAYWALGQPQDVSLQ